MRRYRKANPDKIRSTQLKKLYGITLEDYAAMLAQQGGGCGICGNFNPSPRMMHVDHDHETGRVRGILCLHCNVGIGQLRHSVELLRAAIEYCRE